MAQTFRSGTNDIDAIDFVEMFLDDETQTEPRRAERLVRAGQLPAGGDEEELADGLRRGRLRQHASVCRRSFPTRLRFEDYIYRLWVQQDGIAAAHVDAAQNHTKSNYMRNPPAAEIFNEEVSNLLKRKIKATVARLDELSIAFDYEGEVTAEDARRSSTRSSPCTAAPWRRPTRREPGAGEALRLFAANLDKAFYGFEPDFFQQNLLRIVDDVVSIIKGSIELWPTLVEICYFQKGRRGLPQTKVRNRKKSRS